MNARLWLSSVFAAFWLVPFYLSGAMIWYSQAAYSRLKFQYTTAGLFTRRAASWGQTLIQVHTKGVGEWKTIDTAELSSMGAFGYRQRLDRVLQDTNGKRTADQVRLRLAEWVAQEYAEKHSNEGEVMGVRFGQTFWAANRPELASPKGAWVREPEDMEPSTPFKAYASFTITKGKAEVEMVSVPAKAPSQPRTPKVFERKTENPTPKAAAPQEVR